MGEGGSLNMWLGSAGGTALTLRGVPLGEASGRSFQCPRWPLGLKVPGRERM